MTDKKKDSKKDDKSEGVSKEQQKRADEIGNMSVGDPSNATSTGSDAEQAGEGTVTGGGGAAGGTSGN